MKCAGSIFKNFLMKDLLPAVAELVPANVVREGKIPAAWFLEQVGAKGMQLGGIHVADYHANLTLRRPARFARNGPTLRSAFCRCMTTRSILAECVEIGGSGYVLKDSPSDQLATAIREVQRGGSYLSPRLLTRLVDGFRVQGRNGVRQPRFGTLTKREREILKMLAEGRSVKEIATGFDLSVKTVEAHKFNLMRKLDIHNKAQLVQHAIQKKIIRLMEPVEV